MTKYKLVPEITGKRLKAVRSFSDVKAGDMGGVISNNSFLSHDDDCWVYKGSYVDNCRVVDDAKVMGGEEMANFISGVELQGNVIYKAPRKSSLPLYKRAASASPPYFKINGQDDIIETPPSCLILDHQARKNIVITDKYVYFEVRHLNTGARNYVTYDEVYNNTFKVSDFHFELSEQASRGIMLIIKQTIEYRNTKKLKYDRN